MRQYPVPIRLWIPSAAHPYPDPPYTTGALYLMFEYPFTEMPSPPCSRSWLDLTWLDSLGKSSYEIQFSSVTQSCLTLCSPIDCSTPGFAVHHQLPELAQTLSSTPVIESVRPSNHLILCVPFSSHLQSCPASGSFQMSQFFTLGGQSIGVSASASVLPVNIQDWFPRTFSRTSRKWGKESLCSGLRQLPTLA